MLKRIIKRLLFGHRCSKESYVNYLRKCGVKVGEHIEIFSPQNTVIETLNPHLLQIGDYVSMTGPITILNHDYSVSVLKKWTNGEILGKQKKTIIGDNVFLGWGCCILPGTKVGNNTIIGAYSVVSGVLDDDSVYAGNPARKICSISDFYKKIKDKQIEDACTVYSEWYKRFGHQPPIEVFHEYFYLFEGGNYDNLPNKFQAKFADHGNYNETLIYFKNHTPVFASYDEFCEYAKARMEA